MFGRSFIFQRKTHFLGDKKMRFFKKCLMFFTVISFAASVCSAFEAVTSPNDTNATGASAGLTFPYVAQVTADDVYVRCGPGTNYYPCGKVNATDRVTVVATKFGWSHIVPPPGSFSWISKQYVAVDQNNPGIGTVTGDSVSVYAGSEYREPIHCETVQLRLNKGDKVELTGVEEADYYKIVPPAGAYLWALTDYTRPLGPAGGSGTVVEYQPVPQEAAPVPENPVETEKLKEYYVLQEQIKAELAKPVAEQDYTAISKALSVIAENKDAGKAARYAQFALKQIGRYELAFNVEKAARLQDAQFEQAKEQIDKTRTEKLAASPDLGKYTAVGLFQISSVYDPQMQHQTYYRIVDGSDKTICYAIADGPAAQMDLSKFAGKQVGIVGTVVPHPQTGGTLVKFTEIVELTR